MKAETSTRRTGWRGFFTPDMWTAAAVLVFVLAMDQTTAVFRLLENRLYDHASVASGRKPSDQVVVLAIDEESVARIGRWPWSRDVHAKVMDRLGQAKLVVSTVLFNEPQQDRGTPHLQAIRSTLALAPADAPLVQQALQQTDRALQELDTDAALERALAASGRVVLPVVLTQGEQLGRADQALPGFAARALFDPLGVTQPEPTVRADWPLARFGSVAKGLGHLNQLPDPDGVLRRDPLFLEHNGKWVPSLALAAATQALNLSPKDLVAPAEATLRMGKLAMPVDGLAGVYPQYYPTPEGALSAFSTDSFYDVWSGKVSPERYAGKIVLIGALAPGIGSAFATPVSHVTYAVHVLAHNTSSVLQGHFFAQPWWGPLMTAGLMAVVLVLAVWVLPRLGGSISALVTAGVALTLLVGGYGLVAWAHVRLDTMLPLVTLAAAYMALTTRRFLFTEAGKSRADEESAETNRLMGLALQGQGQLDMAFDRFRRVPLGDALMDNLANLALDFERKRQFNKAQAVYEHMASHNPRYKDLPNRLKRVRNLSETVMLGGGGGKTGTLLLDGGEVEKPMLGRYQVEKELGKGAMGVVYQGRDPKIGRVVAIKTMALSQEFEGSELDDARERFFREAETAGRLQHPHIVTIYDAGEDQELAYIAMEFLRGRDLVEFAQPGRLLPVGRVLGIGVRVAEALHYAHGLHVVHRDIKPANIMYEPEADVVKVTDFGIARITDASRTRTGMVLGTPSFMSPEQIAGKKVDGRSDLYSLGVTLYQLLCGQLPFKAESMAELMFKIANEPAPDVRMANPAVPADLAEVVLKAMAKDLSVRHASGQDLAAALRACASGAKPAGVGQSAAMAASVPDVPVGPVAPEADDGFAQTQVMPHAEDAVVVSGVHGRKGGGA